MDSSYNKPMRLFVIPGWIYKAVLRNKLNTVDIADYAKMRSILSLDDLAEWVYINDRFKINNYFVSTLTIDGLFSNLNSDQKSEFLNSVAPLSASEEIATSIATKLQLSNPMNAHSYQFITVEDNTFIILNEGFLSRLSEDNFMLDFIRKYLQVCYSLHPVHRVSETGMYSLYVKKV